MTGYKDRTTQYDEGSLTLPGTVMLGTGVMIGAGIFALTGQMAEMTGVLFPLAFLAAAVIIAFSAYVFFDGDRPKLSGSHVWLLYHAAFWR